MTVQTFDTAPSTDRGWIFQLKTERISTWNNETPRSKSTILCVHNQPLIVFCKTLHLSVNNHLFLIFTIFIPLFILKDTVEIDYTGAWGCQNMSHVNCINLLLESYPKSPKNIQTFISDMHYEPKWFRSTCVMSGKRKITCYMFLAFQSDQFPFPY